MSSIPPSGEVPLVCPHCGAQYAAGAAKCWLCNADLSDAPVLVAELVSAPPGEPAWSLTEAFFAGLSALTALLVVLLGIGLFAQQPGLGVIYVILVIPPLTVTAARTFRKTRSGAGISWAERLATFVISSVVMLGVLGMLAIAAVACLIIYCIFDPPRWH